MEQTFVADDVRTSGRQGTRHLTDARQVINNLNHTLGRTEPIPNSKLWLVVRFATPTWRYVKFSYPQRS